MQILEDTPDVLSLGKLCEEHGCTYDWVSGPKPHLAQNGKIILCNTENIVPVVVQCLQARAQVRLPHFIPQDSSNTSPSPARLRSDDAHAQASGDRDDRPKTKNEKEDNTQATRSRLRDLPEWLTEFTDNLEDTDVPALEITSHDSDSERPTKVTTKKHDIYTHFPKGRNREICKRTKKTRVVPYRKRTGEALPRAEKFGDSRSQRT